jgi:hypothetical protein
MILLLSIIHFGLIFSIVEIMTGKEITKGLRVFLRKKEAKAKAKGNLTLANEIKEILECKICSTAYSSYFLCSLYLLCFFLLKHFNIELVADKDAILLIILNFSLSQFYGFIVSIINKIAI